MKKQYALGLVTAFVAALGLATAAPAMATDCVPKDAWVEHIDHPAIGEPKITVDNPDYQPATPDTTKVVHHDAEPDTTTYIHHDGTPDTTEVTGYMKWTWTAGHKQEPTTAPPADGWHQVGITSDSKGNTPDTIIHQGGGYGSYFYFETQTKVVSGTPAWDEPVVTPGKPAWDETVTVPGTPAVGEPTIEIDNPDYKPAWVEDVNHDAVVCESPNPGPQPNAETTYNATAPVLTCDGWSSSYAETYYADYYLSEDGTKWILGEPMLADHTDYPAFDATWDEKAQIDCAKPAEVVVVTNTYPATCDAIGQTIERTATTPWEIGTYVNSEGKTLKQYVAGDTVYDYRTLATTPKKDCTISATPLPAAVDNGNNTPAASAPSALLTSSDSLAQTGSNATWVPLTAIAAILTIAIVSALMWIARRRRMHSEQ